MRYQSIQQKMSDLPVYLFSSLPGYYILILLYFVKSLYGQVVLGGVMNIVTELALIFGVCLIGIGIASLLPFMVPYSVISLLVLTLLLYRKILRPEQIKDAGGFFIRNMGIFLCLEIWPFILPVRIIHLMECRCRISGSDALTILCYDLQSLVTQILREDLEGTFKLRVDI